MRNLSYFVTLVVGALLTFFVLLPLLGFVLMVVAALAVLAVIAYLALPWLARLPWFRIHTAYRARDWQPPGGPGPARPMDDVIDVEGREIPDKE